MINTNLDSKERFSAKELESAYFKRVFSVKTPYDIQRLRDRWDEKDVLVIHSSKQSQGSSEVTDLVRQLEKSLPEDIQIVVVDSPGLLAEFGIIPENYLWTIRYLRRVKQQTSQDITVYRHDPTSNKWIEVACHFTIREYLIRSRPERNTMHLVSI